MLEDQLAIYVITFIILTPIIFFYVHLTPLFFLFHFNPDIATLYHFIHFLTVYFPIIDVFLK